MKKIEKRRGIFSSHENIPETDKERVKLLPRYERPQVRVEMFLTELDNYFAKWDALAFAWRDKKISLRRFNTQKAKLFRQSGSEGMLREVRDSAKFLRAELRARRDPWRLVDLAMTLARRYRDFQANEALLPTVTYATKTQEQRATARKVTSENKRAKADLEALREFKQWQAMVRSQLLDPDGKSLDAAERVKKYKVVRKGQLSARASGRINRLLREGKIPPLN